MLIVSNPYRSTAVILSNRKRSYNMGHGTQMIVIPTYIETFQRWRVIVSYMVMIYIYSNDNNNKSSNGCNANIVTHNNNK